MTQSAAAKIAHAAELIGYFDKGAADLFRRNITARSTVATVIYQVAERRVGREMAEDLSGIIRSAIDADMRRLGVPGY